MISRVISRTRPRRVASSGVWYLCMCALGAIFVFPFVWMVLTALKPSGEIYAFPIKWIPSRWNWNVFADTIGAVPFWLYVKNTAIITLTSVCGTVISASLVAYGFARMAFKGRNVLFVVLVFTMAIPYQVTIIPLFVLYSKIHMINTFWPLILPNWFAPAFYVFLLRQFFMALPRDLEDAAFVDGCTRLGAWWRIILPLSRPALVTVVVLSFVAHWNDFFGPLVFLNNSSLYTLSVAITSFQSAESTNWNMTMALAIMMILPCVVLFFALQRYFVEGITMSGMK